MSQSLVPRGFTVPAPLSFLPTRRSLAIHRAAALERTCMHEARITATAAMGEVVQLKVTQHEYEVFAPDCTELLSFMANGVGVAIGNRAIQFAAQVGT